MVDARKVDSGGDARGAGEAGLGGDAAVARRLPATDPLGQAAGDGSTGRQPARAVSAGVRAVPARLSPAGSWRRDARRPDRRPAGSHAIAPAARDAVALTFIGDQRDGAAPVPRRAAAA